MSLMIRSGLLLSWLLTITTLSPVVADDDAIRKATETVDRMATDELAKQPIGGCTVGVVVKDKLIWAHSYGVADIEGGVAANNQHVYRIGSITKQFTGLMLLQLVEDGVVRPSDPVEKHFPEVKVIQGRSADDPPVTFIQLATMTSGMNREPSNLPTYLKGSVDEWESVLTKALKDTRYRFAPDTRYYYSNIGYAVLGASLGRAAKQPYVTFVKQRTLEPLQMHDSAFKPNDRIRSRIAKGYSLRNGVATSEISDREHEGRGYKVPNGAMYTTVGDLARFVSFELGYGSEKVLSKQAVDRAFSRVNSADGQLNSGYGACFSLFRHDGLVMAGHSGSVAGYNAAAYVHRPSASGVIVLRNVAGGKFNSRGLCMRALAVVAKRGLNTED